MYYSPQEAGDSWKRDRCLTELARIAIEQGQYERAQALLEWRISAHTGKEIRLCRHALCLRNDEPKAELAVCFLPAHRFLTQPVQDSPILMFVRLPVVGLVRLTLRMLCTLEPLCCDGLGDIQSPLIGSKRGAEDIERNFHRRAC